MANDENIENTARTLTSIINYTIPMPVCTYSTRSRRHRAQSPAQQQPLRKTVKEQLEQLEHWKNYSEIAIDGQNGTTKSSIAKLVGRKYLKVNELFPNITCGPDYNHRPLKSIDYLATQALTKSENTIWDRCMYSNLIFYYVHHLMYAFADVSMPNDDAIIWPILNNMALSTGLLDLVHFVQSLKSVPTIFIVCRNVDLIAESLRVRGLASNTVNDLWNSKEYNYQMAQYHVYRWFGKLMDYPTFDLVDFFEEGYTVDDVQIMIASKITTWMSPDNFKMTLPNRNGFDEFDSLIEKYNDDILMYEHSRK